MIKKSHLHNSITRRTALAGIAAGTCMTPEVFAARRNRPRVAVILTELRFRSHAYNIMENFIAPFLFRGKLVDPGVELVSMYVDQHPDGDMSADVSERFQIPILDSIAETISNGNSLTCDAILLIGEHGTYPLNQRGQVMYPRHQFLKECVDVFAKCGSSVPVFNDKHLSYQWYKASQMYQWSKQFQFPMMAGSSVPLAQQITPLNLKSGAPIAESVSVHGGGIESYDFHALEVLQSIVESRQGAETGVATVQLLERSAARGKLRDQTNTMKLLTKAMNAELSADFQPRTWPGRETPSSRSPVPVRPNEILANLNHALFIGYKDGTSATVASIGNDANRWNFACDVMGQPETQSTAYYNGPWGNRCLFKALSHSIQQFFISGRPVYPVERTLLVNAIIEASLISKQRGGLPTEARFLDVRYGAPRWHKLRENGKSWELITGGTEQPFEFSPGDARFL